jgi:hypothetical protein
MAQWTRAGDLPDSMKVSFVVTRKDNPQLLEWLYSLPYRGQSKIVREMLEAAILGTPASPVVTPTSRPVASHVPVQAEASILAPAAPTPAPTINADDLEAIRKLNSLSD